MKKKHALRAGIVIGLGFAVQSAFAATATVQYNGSANFGSGAVGYGSGSIWPNPSHPGTPVDLVGVGVGGDNFLNSPAPVTSLPTTFNAWCVDIFHWEVGGPITYTVGNATDLAGHTDTAIIGSTTYSWSFSQARVNALSDLANERYSALSSKTDSAAFQLSVWAIMFGTPSSAGAYSLNSATFSTSSGITGGTEASTWLSTLGTASKTGNYGITYLYAPDPSSQDMVVFTPLHQQTPPVPEPETYAMLLAGLGLLGFIGRRRKLKATAIA